jgi:hypothetical protein
MLKSAGGFSGFFVLRFLYRLERKLFGGKGIDTRSSPVYNKIV